MGIFDWMFLKNVSDESETEDESAEDESGDDGDDSDDSKEDRAIAAAIEGANSLNEKDWYAQEQHEAYVALADAALAVKNNKAARRATARAKAEQEEQDRVQRAQVATEKADRRPEREVVRTPTGGQVPAGASRFREEPAPRTQRPGHDAGRTERGRQGEDEAQAAATRLANAQASQLEAQTALLRAQAEAAMRAVALELGSAEPTNARHDRVAAQGPKSPAASAPGSRPRAPVPPPVMLTHPTMGSGMGTMDAEFSEADHLALVSVARWPPTPADRRGPFWSRADDYPAEWTLTGFELANFRGGVSVTRSVLASQLGVSAAEIKDAETRPKERVGPALQIALRRAIDVAAEQRRRRRQEVAPTTDQPAREAELPVLATLAPAVTMEGTADAASRGMYTGADLARLRAARHLSQRAMAQILGVEQGTISKGEGKAGAALGPALQEAIGRLAGGGGKRGGGEPEILE